jgi:hypothetical protein
MTAKEYKVQEWITSLNTIIPFEIGDYTITSISGDTSSVTIQGFGGSIDWPLIIVNPPLNLGDDGVPHVVGALHSILGGF